MLEAQIKAQIVDYLQYRGAHVIKIIGHLGREGERVFRQRPGILDLIVCYRGYFLGVETKTRTGKPTQKQEEEIERIQRAGGRAVIARCIEDVAAALMEIDKEVSG